MAIQASQPNVNPRLGQYFACFTSALFALVVLLILLEQLGIAQESLNLTMIIVLSALTLSLGIGASTNDVHEFFVAGRSVSANFNGFTLAISSLGATGLVALIGIFFFRGLDAFALELGWLAGFILMAVLFAPYLRKMGAFTIPGFLQFRFQSRSLRLLTVLALILPAVFILIAELRIGILTASLVINFQYQTISLLVGLIVIMSVIGGGMRSLTWIQCALLLLVLVGFLLPLTILAILLTNLPIPQLTYGTLFDDLILLEQSSGIVIDAPVTSQLIALPHSGLQKIQSPFLQYSSGLSGWNFIVVFSCIMAGISTLPTLLVRCGTTLDIYEARKSVAWGIFLLGIIIMSVPAYAVFAKYITLKDIVGSTFDQLPQWISLLTDSGQLSLSDTNQSGNLDLNEIMFARDGIALILPIVAEFPYSLIALTILSVTGAAIAGATAQLLSLSNMITDDVLYGLWRVPGPGKNRVIIVRVTMCLIATGAIWLVNFRDLDGLKLLLWSLSLSGATLFPVLIYSIWWNRFNLFGAMASIISGFAVTVLYIWFTEVAGGSDLFGISNMFAGALGIPSAFIAGFAVSLMTPSTSQKVFEIIEDMRIPGGETLYDRAHRLATRKH